MKIHLLSSTTVIVSNFSHFYLLFPGQWQWNTDQYFSVQFLASDQFSWKLFYSASSAGANKFWLCQKSTCPRYRICTTKFLKHQLTTNSDTNNGTPLWWDASGGNKFLRVVAVLLIRYQPLPSPFSVNVPQINPTTGLYDRRRPCCIIRVTARLRVTWNTRGKFREIYFGDSSAEALRNRWIKGVTGQTQFRRLLTGCVADATVIVTAIDKRVLSFLAQG